MGEIVIPDEWNLGDFELNINRCSGCNAHFHYCRHSEDEYIQAFNDLGDQVLQVFPKISLVGNYEKVPSLGEFEVYVRCLGFKHQRDHFDRFFLFRKSLRNRFPEK